jgi:hypothetical protein
VWSDEKWQRIGVLLGVDLTQPRSSAEDKQASAERRSLAQGRAA